jgi:hypothetical protein
MSAFNLDLTQFTAKLKQITQTVIPEAARKGMFQAMNELKHDSDKEPPKTPVKEGHLKGSWRVEISPGGFSGNIEIIAGFNIEYASYVHEMFYGIGFGDIITPGTWTEPGSGPKFLESKLTRYFKKYLEIINRNIVLAGGRT